MNDNDKAFMRRAVELAQNGVDSNQGGPFGCVIVKDGQIVGEGCNEVTSTNDPTAHAEIVAIRRACAALNSFNLPDCDIYTSCEPCPMCLGAIYWARLRRIYFANTRAEAAAIGFDDDFIYREMAIEPHARGIPGVRLADADAQVVFQEWMQSPDKVRY